MGFESGVSRCARIPKEPLKLTTTPFLSADDANRGGDLEFEKSVDVSRRLLDAWIAKAAPGIAGITDVRLTPAPEFAGVPTSCSGARELRSPNLLLCAAEDGQRTLFVNDEAAQNNYARIGDLALTAFLAQGYAYLLQEAKGQDLPNDKNQTAGARSANLTNDCLIGGFLRDATVVGIPGLPFSLSPGDLDELVIRLIRTASPERGSIFDRVRVTRVGFSNGTAACTNLS